MIDVELLCIAIVSRMQQGARKMSTENCLKIMFDDARTQNHPILKIWRWM